MRKNKYPEMTVKVLYCLIFHDCITEMKFKFNRWTVFSKK